MLEIIALIFLTRKIGALAITKGLKPGAWKAYTIAAWFAAEIIGLIIGAQIFGMNNLISIMFFALFCAGGGYLFVQATLQKKPDSFEDDINNLGS